MKLKKEHIIATILLLVYALLFAQDRVLYKEIDTTKLFMEVYYPNDIKKEEKTAGIVFFFGGGWQKGTISQFKPHAQYFAKRGLICFLVEYRIENIHKTTPFESLKDAKSAIRYIRKYATQFNLDKTQIVACGGSAGGHLAAACALINDYNECTDDLSVSSIPNALVLFNPVIDNGPGGYGYERIGDAYKEFSPIHNIVQDAPPTIMFFGNEDHLVPVETPKYYKMVMEKVNSRCELHMYDGQKHGFFNYNNFEYYKKTLEATDAFMQSFGYLSKEPLVEIK